MGNDLRTIVLCTCIFYTYNTVVIMKKKKSVRGPRILRVSSSTAAVRDDNQKVRSFGPPILTLRTLGVEKSTEFHCFLDGFDQC